MADREHPHVKTLRRELVEGKVDRREFLRVSTLLGLSAGAAYAFADKVAPGEAFAQAATPPGKGGTLRISMRCQKIDDPHTYSWIESSNSGRLVMDYLTRTHADNVTRPALVQKWEASPDLKTWTLHLRRDVKWRKGRQFTADDVVWNLKRVCDPKTGSSMVGLLKGFLLEDVETGEKDDKGNPKKTSRLWDANAIQKVDDFTVRLNGKSAQLAVPEQLYHYPMLIMDPAENGVFGVGANGTGPFELVENEVGKKQVYVARKDGYWGGGPYLDRIEIIDLGDDPAPQIAALASGQVDLLYGADVGMKAALDAIPTATRYQVDTGYTAVVRFHPKKPFDDKRVRQAVHWATDVDQALALAHGGLGKPGEHHHVAPAHPEYAPMQPYKRDVAKAKALLAAAGYPNGIDFEMALRPQPAWEANCAQVLVDQWKEAGIRCKLNIMPSAQYWDVWTKVPVGLTTWAHRPLGVMVLGLAYRTGVPWNESAYSNPEFDKLITEAEGILDVNERRKVMAKIQTLLLDDAPVVVPLWRSLITYANKKVKGFEVHPSLYIHGHELGVS